MLTGVKDLDWHICDFLFDSDLLSLGMVNKQMCQSIVNNDGFWEHRYKDRYVEDGAHIYKSWKKFYEMSINHLVCMYQPDYCDLFLSTPEKEFYNNPDAFISLDRKKIQDKYIEKIKMGSIFLIYVHSEKLHRIYNYIVVKVNENAFILYRFYRLYRDNNFTHMYLEFPEEAMQCIMMKGIQAYRKMFEEIQRKYERKLQYISVGKYVYSYPSLQPG